MGWFNVTLPQIRITWVESCLDCLGQYWKMLLDCGSTFWWQSIHEGHGRRKVTSALACLASPLVLGMVYFNAAAADPFTDTRTNVFKLSSWTRLVLSSVLQEPCRLLEPDWNRCATQPVDWETIGCHSSPSKEIGIAGLCQLLSHSVFRTD